MPTMNDETLAAEIQAARAAVTAADDALALDPMSEEARRAKRGADARVADLNAIRASRLRAAEQEGAEAERARDEAERAAYLAARSNGPTTDHFAEPDLSVVHMTAAERAAHAKENLP